MSSAYLSSQTPFRLPAEWEPHQATLLTWPHNSTDWPGKIREVRSAYINIIQNLHTEPVWLLTGDAKRTSRVKSQLEASGTPLDHVQFIEIETDRSWIRDYGPICVFDEDGKRIILDFNFNGWARFSRHQKDNATTSQLTPRLCSPSRQVLWNHTPVVLEGGSIDTNGQGILLTTEECLLSTSRQKRNPHLSKKDLEEMFARYFGTSEVIWLGRGIEGDDTHGHVDDITRFVDPTTLITMVESNTSDPNHQVLKDNHERLKQADHLSTVEIPMPQKVMYRDYRLPVSYANFLIANECVLVPVFDDPNDDEALGILSKLFPTRTVVGIESLDILTGLGGLHCISMQIPALPANHEA